MKTIVIFTIALMLWLAGMNGNLGSILAAVIDPSSLVEGQLPTPGTLGGQDAGGFGGGASGSF
jgi:hypothetical protein